MDNGMPLLRAFLRRHIMLTSPTPQPQLLDKIHLQHSTTHDTSPLRHCQKVPVHPGGPASIKYIGPGVNIKNLFDFLPFLTTLRTPYHRTSCPTCQNSPIKNGYPGNLHSDKGAESFSSENSALPE